MSQSVRSQANCSMLLHWLLLIGLTHPASASVQMKKNQKIAQKTIESFAEKAHFLGCHLIIAPLRNNFQNSYLVEDYEDYFCLYEQVPSLSYRLGTSARPPEDARKCILSSFDPFSGSQKYNDYRWTTLGPCSKANVEKLIGKFAWSDLTDNNNKKNIQQWRIAYISSSEAVSALREVFIANDGIFNKKITEDVRQFPPISRFIPVIIEYLIKIPIILLLGAAALLLVLYTLVNIIEEMTKDSKNKSAMDDKKKHG